jgi:hypothetical protein
VTSNSPPLSPTAPTAAAIDGPGGVEGSKPILPDEVTEEILLRLDGAADVARVAVTCSTHLRVVSNSVFLRRFRSLRPPPVVGLLPSTGTLMLHHAEPPHSSAPAGRAVARVGDFAFSFLPMDPATFTKWEICDARGGRVLLSRTRLRRANVVVPPAKFLDLAVADPLHRRYVLVPPIPGEIVRERCSDEMRSEPFLAAAAARREEETGEGSQFRFQIIYNWMSSYEIDTFVFTSDTGEWCAATSFSFFQTRMLQSPKLFVRYCVANRFYWVHYQSDHMFMFDQCEMKFSISRLPFPCSDLRRFAVFDAGVNGLGFMVLHYRAARPLEVYYMKNDGGGAEEGALRHVHSFTPSREPGYSYMIVGEVEGYMVLEGKVLCLGIARHTYFTVDLKTFQIEKLCTPGGGSSIYPALLYASYPLLLSPPTISSQQYFSPGTNQPPAISHQHFSPRTNNQRQPPATSQMNRFYELVRCFVLIMLFSIFALMGIVSLCCFTLHLRILLLGHMAHLYIYICLLYLDYLMCPLLSNVS